MKFSPLELSRLLGTAWSSRNMHSRSAELYIHSFSGIVPNAIPHFRRIDYADLLVSRPHTSRCAQLCDPRLANFTASHFRSNCHYCVIRLVRKKFNLHRNRRKIYLKMCKGVFKIKNLLKINLFESIFNKITNLYKILFLKNF